MRQAQTCSEHNYTTNHIHGTWNQNDVGMVAKHLHDLSPATFSQTLPITRLEDVAEYLPHTHTLSLNSYVAASVFYLFTGWRAFGQ